jgi:hypothetical protein
MRLLSSHITQEDHDAVRHLVRILKQKQPDITVKRYVAHAVLTYTQAVLTELEKQASEKQESNEVAS